MLAPAVVAAAVAAVAAAVAAVAAAVEVVAVTAAVVVEAVVAADTNTQNKLKERSLLLRPFYIEK